MVIIGDFNDHPHNTSVLNILGADTTKTNNTKSFFNTSFAWQKRGLGTYHYKGEWGVLDHIVITKKMANNEDVFQGYFSEIINNSFLLYTNKNGETRPSRSYQGLRYFWRLLRSPTRITYLVLQINYSSAGEAFSSNNPL